MEHRAPQAAGRPLGHSPDGELVRLHLSGDTTAFESLYRTYFGRLKGFCFGKVRDCATAEDLAQEALIRAWINLDRFSPDYPMWPWLRTIATRLVIDELRRRVPEPHPDPAGHLAVVDDLVAVEEGPLLRAALRTVSSRDRTALVMRYLEDRPTPEAAELLGLSDTNYQQVLSRARRRLAAAYLRALRRPRARAA